MELVLDRVSKQYQNKIAVDRVSLTLKPGVIGLLGENGAGKTTLMRMICGILRPDSGTITFDGMDVSEELYRDALGYLPQDFGYYPNFTGKDFLMYMSALKGLDKKTAKRKGEELLRIVNLEGAANKKMKAYSGGMKQRLGIAQAVLNDPKILILDDSTSAVDTKTDALIRRAFREEIPDTTKIIIAQRIASIEKSDLIVVLDNGRIADSGKHDELLSRCKIYQEVYYSQNSMGGDR